mgnify:FL=1
MKNQKYSEAVTSFEACLKENPKETSCHWEIGWAHWMLSDWDQVVKSWDTLQKSGSSQS